jgi:guanylate kinase
MNKLIVVSGLNGIGKSTAVKNLMLNGDCKIVTILHDNKKLSFTINETFKIVVFGDYIKNVKFPGIDQYKRIVDIHYGMDYLMKNYYGYDILMENTQFCKNNIFAIRMKSIADNFDYKFIYTYFKCDFKEIANRLKSRGSDINEKNAITLFRHFERMKSQIPGIDFRAIDVTNLSSEEMTNYIGGLRNEN